MTEKEIESLVEEIVKQLKINNGAGSIESLLNNDGPKIRAVAGRLHAKGLTTANNINNTHYNILTDYGWSFTSFEEEREQDAEKKKVENLSKEKLGVDLANAKHVYNTYNLTRLFAWIGAISGVIALLLKALELLGILHPKQ